MVPIESFLPDFWHSSNDESLVTIKTALLSFKNKFFILTTPGQFQNPFQEFQF